MKACRLNCDRLIAFNQGILGKVKTLEAKQGDLLIKKVYSVDEAFSMPVITRESPEVIEKDIDDESEQQEEPANG